jgi:hypothetical protein
MYKPIVLLLSSFYSILCSWTLINIMKTQSATHMLWGTFGNLLLPIIIALTFFAFTFSYYPFREKIQYNTDEGFNVMRSMLVVLGHPLYLEVASDQPPLFTQLLGLLFRFTGFELNPGRVLVLLFSTLLVWATVQFLQITWGKLAATLFLPIVLMVPLYLRLSVSVMIGLPSIALAVVSMLFLTLWHQKRRNLWLILSGLALALSLLIKFFTFFLVPIFLIGITLSIYFENRQDGFSWKMFQPALVWGVCLAGAVILLGLALIGPQNIAQIILPHLAASTDGELQRESNSINDLLQPAIPFLLLGLLGVVFLIYKRNWFSLYPVIWSVFIYIALNFYAPVWTHHQLLVTVPVAIMAAVAVAEGIHTLVRLKQRSDFVRPQALLAVTALITLALVLVHSLPVLNTELMDSPRITDILLRGTPGKLKIIRIMGQYADQTNWIMTDMPIYAFIAKRPVPPRLATFSQKQLMTGSLTDKDIIAVMRTYRPEQVLIGRFFIPALEEYVKENYTIVTSPETFRLYIRNDLKPVTQ